MNSLIAIIAGEPASINSEIIAKAWKKKYKNIFIIGNYSLIEEQFLKLNIKIPLFKVEEFKDIEIRKRLLILDIPLKYNSIFKHKSSEVKKYIFKCFDVAHKLAINKKILGFINAPIDKNIFNNKYLGVTEYLANKNKCKNKEVMFIHNRSMSVVPLTTHVELKNVTSKITQSLIKSKVITLNKFYFKLFKKKPKIALLGLNPHNSENRLNSIESKIIKPSVKKLKELGLNVDGPFPADTAFNEYNRSKFNVIVGMYHDQVLGPFKALFEYDAINITLGLKYIRISPDHGTAQDIVGLNRANPQSLISAINFFNKIND